VNIQYIQKKGTEGLKRDHLRPKKIIILQEQSIRAIGNQ